MRRTGRAIQLLVLFSVLLGIVFLWQVSSLLPSMAFEFVATGWVLFVVDGALTFVRPRTAYYLAWILALLALGTSLPQSAHFAFIQEGALLPSLTFIAGSAAQLLLIVLVPYHFLRERRSAKTGVVQGQ